MAYEIGQHFKEQGTGGSAAHIMAHAVLRAAVAAAGGNNALSAALAAGGSEAIIPVVSDWLYGTHDPDKLTADQKQTLSTIASLAGASVGAATGNIASTVSGSQAAQGAVENNYLAFGPQSDRKARNKFNKKVESELGGKFELKGTEIYNSLGYEIMELVPVGNATIQDLTPDQLAFYNMLNGVITDTTGTAQITLVYDDNQTVGGSWIKGTFDVGDMEKLDSNHITLS